MAGAHARPARGPIESGSKIGVGKIIVKTGLGAEGTTASSGPRHPPRKGGADCNKKVLPGEGAHSYFRPSSSSARVAQLAEHLICNQKVAGSIPVAGSEQQNGIGPYGPIPFSFSSERCPPPPSHPPCRCRPGQGSPQRFPFHPESHPPYRKLAPRNRAPSQGGASIPGMPALTTTARRASRAERYARAPRRRRAPARGT